MKIKQVSKLTGLTEKTIRYYESKGLITPDIHDLNGRSFRDYGKEQIAALNAVSVLRRARFTIEQIRDMQQNLSDWRNSQRLFNRYRSGSVPA